MALEHVAQGQTRFNCPGLVVDNRGVALGKHALLTFATLEGVVSWLRLYSAEASIDEVAAGLAIWNLRSRLGGREMGIRIPAQGSHACDRAARLARLVGGGCFVGGPQQYVRFRDDRSPYGYDAADVEPVPAGMDFTVHDRELTQSYAVLAELPLLTLLLRLSLRSVPLPTKLSDEDRSDLMITVVPGLADGVIRYLARNRVQAAIGRCQPAARGAFDAGDPAGYYLVRIHDLPERITKLFLGTPGIAVLQPVGSHAAVALGYRHPIELAACATVFPTDQFHLFFPDDRVDVVPGPLQLSAIEHLGAIHLVGDAEPTRVLAVGKPDPIAVELQLRPTAERPRRVRASLIPMTQAARLRRLLFALPPALLRGQRIAVCDRGILIIASEGGEPLPLGEMLAEAAPGVWIAAGYELVPKVDPTILASALGHVGSVVTVLPGEGTPFRLPVSGLLALDRHAVGQLAVDEPALVATAAEPLALPTVVNDPVGRFALWGFPAAPDAGKLLPE